MAPTVDEVLAGKYPAKAHARKVAAYLRDQGLQTDGVIYLESQKTKLFEDNDTDQPFRQRRFFFYLSGCLLPDSLLTYHISSDKLTLYIPPLDPESVIWSGLPVSPEDALKAYDVDQVLVTSEINPTLAHLGTQVGQDGTVFSIQGQISDETSLVPFPKTDVKAVKTAIEECRVVKDAYEVAMIRKANDVTAKAHIAVYKAAKSATNERELAAAFIGTCIAHGCPQMAYPPIVASGTSSATLHYVRNDDSLYDPATKERKLNLLLDAGGEYRTYAADVTRSVPLSGTFSPESRSIYDIVLQMQLETLAMIKEGVLWEDVHIKAHRIAIKGLLKLGVLQGTEEELFQKRISVAFFPHGLGHYLGMDTHDTGGHANYEDKDSMFKALRVRGTLPAGSVITVEPGVYFCRFIIQPYLDSPELSQYINQAALEKYWTVGGVRIEDNIHVTKDGYENLTTAPKSLDEIELLANGP